MVELGIVDIREIIRLIKNQFDIDFSAFALTSFKYRLEHIIAKNNLVNPENLYRRLTDRPEFFDTFLSQLFVPSTEMFRDPSVWRWLRESYFHNLSDKDLINFKVWLPYCVSGGELFSLCILLKEIGLLNKIKILATVFSAASLEYIQSGEYPVKKLEVSAENYQRFQGTAEFEGYYKSAGYVVKRDTSLIESVEFITDDINYNKCPKNVRLILMRNVMIYFNPSYQERLLHKIHEESISANGNLIIGIKELVRNNQNSSNLFEVVDKNECIYRKRMS